MSVSRQCARSETNSSSLQEQYRLLTIEDRVSRATGELSLGKEKEVSREEGGRKKINTPKDVCKKAF